MADIQLSAAVRNNLLSLKDTSDLISRTQERLSTGLKVNSPIDDAKVFFEAKALNDVRVEPASRLASLEASLAAMTQRAELAESECEALRNGREPMPRQQPPPQP